ncbi:MAG: DUF3052 domain-containing protein [Acidimicrobiia bacterium]|nr:DUF3052 domain-containing protein [Acidimicrobiia bacterium]
MAGYSGTPLVKKLGIKEGMTVLLGGAPDGFVGLLGEPQATFLTAPAPCDIAIVFAVEAAELDQAFRQAMAVIPPDGAIWVAWPKRASKVPTDITEDRCREMFLPTGMVDTKVCAIDDTRSGLRFVVRKENREAWTGRS